MKSHTRERKKGALLFPLIILLLAACGQNQTPAPDTTATAFALSLQQTMVALDVTVQALSVGQTQAAIPTPTSTPSPVPSPTNTPGPVVINDDFSADVGRWQGCGQCAITNGSLVMGPYPVSNSAEGYPLFPSSPEDNSGQPTL